MSAIARASPSLCTAGAGAGLALLWFEVSELLALSLTTVRVILGLIAKKVAPQKAAQRNPVGAMVWLEAGILTPLALTAALIALGICVGVELEPSDDASVESKKLLAAVVAAIGASLSDVLIKSAEDVDANWLAPEIRSKFQDAYRVALRRRRPTGATATDAELGPPEGPAGAAGTGAGAAAVSGPRRSRPGLSRKALEPARFVGSRVSPC